METFKNIVKLENLSPMYRRRSSPGSARLRSPPESQTCQVRPEAPPQPTAMLRRSDVDPTVADPALRERSNRRQHPYGHRAVRHAAASEQEAQSLRLEPAAP